MTTRIWKTVLGRVHAQDIEIPASAEIISTALQDNQVCIWFKCNPDNVLVKRRIMVCYTGFDDVPEDGIFIGTVQKPSGIVLHVFEVFADEANEGTQVAA